jgi:hypothetical protein
MGVLEMRLRDELREMANKVREAKSAEAMKSFDSLYARIVKKARQRAAKGEMSMKYDPNWWSFLPLHEDLADNICHRLQIEGVYASYSPLRGNFRLEW